MRAALPAVVALALLVPGVARGAGTEEPFRFLVMGDPQFHVPAEGAWEPTLRYGYQWQSPAWHGLPDLMRQLGAERLFVCGDIFERHDGDGTTASGLWDVWDTYLDTFAGTGRVEWITGGHEFWGRTAAQDRRDFLARYPGHVRYVARKGPQAFILFDDLHDPLTFDDEGLQWLEETLRQCTDAEHIWFFGHVPPRNTADWWPASGRAGGTDAFRSRMAALLGQYHVRAAFFGHEHQEGFLGDRGGFPMFVAGCRYPLLVEVRGPDVEYRWVMDPSSQTPLATALAVEGRPLTRWRVAPLAPQQAWSGPPDLPESLDALEFRPAVAANGTVDLSAVEGLPQDGRVLAVADYPLRTGWSTRCALVRSSAPYSLWINGRFLDSAGQTSGRLNGYRYDRRDRNRVVIVLEPGPRRTFTFITHSFPEDMRAEPSPAPAGAAVQQ